MNGGGVSGNAPIATPQVEPASGSCAEVLLVFLRSGCTSFGGLIAHLGYFQKEIVERRKWCSKSTMAEIIALAQSLPRRSFISAFFELAPIWLLISRRRFSGICASADRVLTVRRHPFPADVILVTDSPLSQGYSLANGTGGHGIFVSFVLGGLIDSIST